MATTRPSSAEFIGTRPASSDAASRGSSRVDFIEDIPIAEIVEEKVLKPAQEIFIDQGLPIPEEYDIDTINVLVQDPFHIWVYWELRERVFESLYKVFPHHIAASFYPVLKITELTYGHSAFIGIFRRGSYWLNVFPDRRYRIEVGLRSEERGYVRLLETKEVKTPRGTVSMEISDDPEYHMTNAQFAEILRVSGFAQFAGMLGPERVLRRLPQDVADIIAAAIAGQELTEEQLASLPLRIRALLIELRKRGGPGFTSMALLHMLPEFLRESLRDVEGLLFDPLHPQHIAPRFMVGASESQVQPGRRPWLPSMAERPTSPTRPGRMENINRTE